MISQPEGHKLTGGVADDHNLLRRLEDRMERTTRFHRWAFGLIFLGYIMGMIFIVIFWNATTNLQTQLRPYVSELDFDITKKQAILQAETFLAESNKEFSVGLLNYQRQFFGYKQEQQQQRTDWRFPMSCGQPNSEMLTGLTALHSCESRKINVGINIANPEAALDVNGSLKARKGISMHGLLHLMDCEHMAEDVCSEIFILKQRLSRLEGGGGGGNGGRRGGPVSFGPTGVPV